MMPQTSVIQETQSQSTCETCSKFQDFNESNGRGWCQAFDRAARKDHLLTQDCQQQLESEQLQELLDQYQAYLKPVINDFPGRDVYKQLPELGYERIGYVSENLAGWFALNQHGLTVADKGSNAKKLVLTKARSPISHRSQGKLEFRGCGVVKNSRHSQKRLMLRAFLTAKNYPYIQVRKKKMMILN